MSTTETTYVQGGARFPAKSGKLTKTALKTAIREHPARVNLYATSSMGPQFNGVATELPDGMSFNVVGPDPYTRRDWYATVYKGRDGVVRCK